MVQKTLIVGALVAVTALLMVPMASAQSLSASGLPQPSTIAPETGTAVLKLNYKYQLDNQAWNIAGVQKSSVDISFDFQCDTGVLVSGATTVTQSVELGTSPTSEFNGDATFQVSIARQAAGLKQLNCEVFGETTALFTGAGAASVDAVPSTSLTRFTVTADYFPLISSNVAQKVKDSAPQKNVGFDITINNFGNAKTQVSFEVLSAPSGKRWQVLTPDPIVLDTPYGGTEATSGTARLSVATTYKNGWNNEQAAVQLKIIGEAAEDLANENVHEIQSNVLIRVRGVYVPGLEPLAMLGAVISAALVARMRRDEE